MFNCYRVPRFEPVRAHIVKKFTGILDDLMSKDAVVIKAWNFSNPAVFVLLRVSLYGASKFHKISDRYSSF